VGLNKHTDWQSPFKQRKTPYVVLVLLCWLLGLEKNVFPALGV
jgi:hypothetical protein